MTLCRVEDELFEESELLLLLKLELDDESELGVELLELELFPSDDCDELLDVSEAAVELEDEEVSEAAVELELLLRLLALLGEELELEL